MAYLAGRQGAMVEVLERMTRAESPSDVPGAQIEVREIIATELEHRGFTVRRVPGRTSGGSLHARPAVRDHGGPAQLRFADRLPP